MKNKILLLGICILFLLPAMIQPVYAGSTDAGLLDVSIGKYDPYPAQAGKYVTVWIDVVNRFDPIYDTTFNLEADYPFTIINNATRTYSRITGLDDVRLEYQLLVDKNAPNSTNEIKLRWSNVGEKALFERDFNITVVEGQRDKQADLRALFVDIKPDAYVSGTSKLTLDIINTDDGTAYHTVVKADSAVANIATNEVFVGNLNGDDFDSVDFNLDIKNVPQGTYPVNITMTYKNSDGKEIVQENPVYITVVSQAEAALQNKTETPAWMFVIYIIVIIIIIRALLMPFVRWFVKPFRKKKSHRIE